MAQLAVPVFMRMKQTVTMIRIALVLSGKTMKDPMRNAGQIHRAQHDQHHTHRHLHRQAHPRWDCDAERDDRRAHDHDRDGMPRAPDRSHQRRATNASMTRYDGADRNHVIGVARVPHTEHEPDHYYCE